MADVSTLLMFFFSLFSALVFTSMAFNSYRGWEENRFLRNSRNCPVSRASD